MLKSGGKLLFQGGLESPKFTAEEGGVSEFHMTFNKFVFANFCRNVYYASWIIIFKHKFHISILLYWYNELYACFSKDKIRKYHATKWKTTKVSGMQFDTANTAGFRSILKYPQGNNHSSVVLWMPQARHILLLSWNQRHDERERLSKESLKRESKGTDE